MERLRRVQRLHEVLLDRLRAADALDFSRAAADSSQIGALKGGREPARPQSIEGAPAASHLITEATGVLPAMIPTGANRNDVTQLVPLLHAIPKVRGKRCRPDQRPDAALTDQPTSS